MRATFTVEVPDEFVERRAREMAERGRDSLEPLDVESAAEYFAGRCQDVADDELPCSFYGWPVTIAVSVAP